MKVASPLVYAPRGTRAHGTLFPRPQERFDQLMRIAGKLFQVPTVLIALVDGQGVRFKSVRGPQVNEIPVDSTFCSRVVREDSMLIVRDARVDDRFKDHPLVVSGPKIRFVASRALSGPDGRRLGNLCLFDIRPRSLGAEERALLDDVSALVEDELAACHPAFRD
jgi:GAF domain-containing protein